jgi:hypothetical protein
LFLLIRAASPFFCFFTLDPPPTPPPARGVMAFFLADDFGVGVFMMRATRACG